MDKVTNPLTGRKIKVGGTLHKKLTRQGVFKSSVKKSKPKMMKINILNAPKKKKKKTFKINILNAPKKKKPKMMKINILNAPKGKAVNNFLKKKEELEKEKQHLMKYNREIINRQREQANFDDDDDSESSDTTAYANDLDPLINKLKVAVNQAMGEIDNLKPTNFRDKDDATEHLKFEVLQPVKRVLATIEDLHGDEFPDEVEAIKNMDYKKKIQTYFDEKITNFLGEHVETPLERTLRIDRESIFAKRKAKRLLYEQEQTLKRWDEEAEGREEPDSDDEYVDEKYDDIELADISSDSELDRLVDEELRLQDLEDGGGDIAVEEKENTQAVLKTLGIKKFEINEIDPETHSKNVKDGEIRALKRSIDEELQKRDAGFPYDVEQVAFLKDKLLKITNKII